MASATPDLRLPSQPQGITGPWPVPYYTAWWQRHMCVNNLPKVVTRKRNGRDSNPRPFESQVQRSITTTPPGHQGRLNWTFLYNNVNLNKLFFSPREGSAVLRLCRLTWIFACLWVMAVYSSPVIESQGHRSKSYTKVVSCLCLLVTLVSFWGYKSGWTNRDAFVVDFGAQQTVLVGPASAHPREGVLLGDILGHAQTFQRSIYST